MKIRHLMKFVSFGLSTVLFHRTAPILGTVIITDKCNLNCKHCSVNNINAVIYPYTQVQQEMQMLYEQGIRILFLCGGETFLWQSDGKTLRDLVIEARRIGFYIVNVVTNGTYQLDLPEADLILLSLDGDREHHNDIRGDSYDLIMRNIDQATANNICLYMAVNQINQHTIRHVSDVALSKQQVKAVSFNFHTPYPETATLALSVADKQRCADEISQLMDWGYPIFNLKSALPYIVNNSFITPCHQCVVVENGKTSICGRCIDEPGLCEQCGYFFVAEYTLAFSGNTKVIKDMIKTYLKYI